MVRREYVKLLQIGESGGRLSPVEIHSLLATQTEEEMNLLFQTADRVRHRWVGDEVHFRGIVEFSNICTQNCWYCGLRTDNRQLLRYRMSGKEIVEATRKIQARGIGTAVLQSGEDPWFTRDRLVDLIRIIKEETGLAITLSVGERPYGDYEAWKIAGADRYLLKQETASSQLFSRLRPGRRLADRLYSLRALKELSYEVGSGNIVGLPGQTAEDLQRDIHLFLEYDFDMIGIGPFIPHPRTPLAKSPPGDFIQTLKVLAVTRIVTRNTNLPATTATGVLDPAGRKRALLAGANVIMPDMTPWNYRQHYRIYPRKTRKADDGDSIPELIFSLGRRISRSPGSRLSLHTS